jgi:hypothetical protein
LGPGAVILGTMDIPAVLQNSTTEQTATFTVPNRPHGFPNTGGVFYVNFKVNQDRAVNESDRSNNTQFKGSPVQTASYLPDMYGVALNTPPVMQPGDTIIPNLKIANFGTANPALQGPFQVDLVASTDQNFGPGDTVLASFTVNDLPPLAVVPSQNTVLGDVNITDPANVLRLSGSAVTLPLSGSGYYIGVIIDPQNVIREIHEIGRGPDSTLSPIRRVGPPIPGFPPAGVVSAPAPAGNVFPYAPFGPISTGANPDPLSLTSLPVTTSTSYSDVLAQALAVQHSVSVAGGNGNTGALLAAARHRAGLVAGSRKR